jgi:hypothetical protein
LGAEAPLDGVAAGGGGRRGAACEDVDGRHDRWWWWRDGGRDGLGAHGGDGAVGDLCGVVIGWVGLVRQGAREREGEVYTQEPMMHVITIIVQRTSSAAIFSPSGVAPVPRAAPSLCPVRTVVGAGLGFAM